MEVFWSIGNNAVGSMDGGSAVGLTYGDGECVEWRIVVMECTHLEIKRAT
jgi:hypothetical protein